MTEDELFEDVKYWKARHDALALALRNVRGYIENCDHEPAIDEIDAALSDTSQLHNTQGE